MATLSILNSFSLPTQGRTLTGKQGTSTDSVSTAFEITVTGTTHTMIGTLATATVNTLWDDDNDFPIDWDYLYFWADQDVYLQIVSTTNVIFKILAKVPFTMTYDSLLAAADATIITGGSEPTLVDIDSIVLGNYSGSSVNYQLTLVD